MCLSRSGVRSISGLRRALRTNGATAFTSCTSSSSTVETSASSSRQELRPRRSTCCRSWSSRPSGNRSLLRGEILGQERHLRELGRARDADDRRRMPARRARARRRAACRSRRSPSYAPSRRWTCAGIARAERGLALHHVAVELGRPAHRLAGVVDDEVEPVPRRRAGARQNASTLGVWRRSRPKISSRSPHVGEVGLPRVARGRVAREARRDDQVRAGAQQLDAGLVADLHAPAGEQRDAAAQVGGLGALARS